MDLTIKYSGVLEVFDTPEGERYGRLQFPVGHTWFKFDFATESFQSMSNEAFLGYDFTELEKAYRAWRAE